MPNPSPKYNYPPSEIFSARGGAAVTINGGNQTVTGRGIYVGGSGQISLLTLNGDTLVFYGLTPGVILPVSFTRINNSGTTADATLLAVALY